MIRYLLDTDILSYITKNRFPDLVARIAATPKSHFAISAITFAEILTGIEKAGPHHPHSKPAIQYIQTINVLDWPKDAAFPYAKIRQLTRQQPLHERDMMIAAHAIAIDATLITNNTKHFGRIGPPLRVENWLW